jgi:hypothetical protein
MTSSPRRKVLLVALRKWRLNLNLNNNREAHDNRLGDR